MMWINFNGVGFSFEWPIIEVVWELFASKSFGSSQVHLILYIYIFRIYYSIYSS